MHDLGLIISTLNHYFHVFFNQQRINEPLHNVKKLRYKAQKQGCCSKLEVAKTGEEAV